MARPATKNDLIQAGNEMYQKLIDLLGTVSEADLNGTFTFAIDKEKGAHWERDKNIRDVLIHLYEWQQLVLDWVTANQQGREQQFLKAGYNWKTTADMNMEFWENHQKTSYEEALVLLKKSHSDVMQLIETFTNEELFSKGVYKWVGGSVLGSYFVSATSSHYDWAMKKIRKYLKSLK